MFGNVQTNVAPDDLQQAGMAPGQHVGVRVGMVDHSVPWVLTYGEVDEGRPLLHVDSAGLVALAVRGGSATEHFTLASGTAVAFRVEAG